MFFENTALITKEIKAIYGQLRSFRAQSPTIKKLSQHLFTPFQCTNCAGTPAFFMPVPTRGDGHCILHALKFSLKWQCGQELPSLEEVKEKVLQEARDYYIYEYASCLNDLDLNEFLASLEIYFRDRLFDNQAIDLLLQILSRSLELTIHIHRLEGNYTLIPRTAGQSPVVHVFTKNLHYEGMRTLS